MILRASEVAQRVIGTHIVDSAPPSSPLLFWLQEQCRSGTLAELIREFSEAQPEPLNPKLARVVEVSAAGLKILIPCKMFERECLEKPMEAEVVAWLNPQEKRADRMLFV
jgi:hypothetical protein